MKKLLSLVLTLTMLCTMCAVFGITASAEAPNGEFVTFSSASSFTITAQKKWNGTLYYSTNGEEATWTEYAGGTALTAAQIGGDGDYYLCFRGEGNSIMSDGLSSASSWVISGSNVACSGSIENLRDYTGTTEMGDSCYAFMFRGCTALVTAPSLPATTLAESCYSNMFYGCASLETAPSLPATTLAEDCYYYMFYGCASLETAPSLPATTLADTCYGSMFKDCTTLVTAPSLPAKTLSKKCYSSMFYGCTSLAAAPELPAETLAENCYLGMFTRCTALVTPPELPATTLADYCYMSMFVNCGGLTELPELPATTLANNCYTGMFANCTGIKLYESAAAVGGVSAEWTIPAAANADALNNWNTDIFFGTGGSFTGAPEIGKTYYYPNPALSPKNHDVTASYQAGETAETVYSVDVAWGSMEFTYTSASEGTWNPATHEFDGATAAAWSCDTDANKITVTNHSNAAVDAGLSYTAETAYSAISGTFTEASGTANDSKLELATASGTTVANVPTASATLTLSGALASGLASTKIGSVTVTISDAE